MGININGGFSYMLEKKTCKEFEGKSLLMLGKQGANFSYKDFIVYCKELLFELSAYEIQSKSAETIDSYDLFRIMGFKEVVSLDISNFEGADIIQDLQDRNIPDHLKGRFDYIYDGGTLEHVFDFPTAMRNVSAMLKCGGVVIHDVPAQWMDHGWYSFAPMTFNDYYEVNNFDVKSIYMWARDYYRDLDGGVLRSPDCRYNKNYKFIYQLNIKMQVMLTCIAEKKENSTVDKMPKAQKSYLNLY